MSKYSHSVLKSGVDEIRHELSIEFKNAMKLFVRYNDYGKYVYQLQFSMRSRDRIRYDNYDDRWSVKTKPNHFHPRYREEAIESKMIGDPQHDFSILVQDLNNYVDFVQEDV